MGMMPFAPPMPSQQDSMVGIDPQMIIQMLTSMEPSFEPKYPAWFKKPKRPNAGQIWMDAKKEEGRNEQRVQGIMENYRYLRFETSGIFPRDVAAFDLGDLDTHTASDLVDDWQLLCAIGASFDWHVTKQIRSRTQMVPGQTMEDMVTFMREEEKYRWANTGDMPLAMAEFKTLTSAGQLMSRHICNLDDENYPFDDILVDPASCYPVYGGTRGLQKVYRIMRMSRAQAYADWGEPRGEDRKKHENEHGRDDSILENVCEYADTWYRAAVLQGGVPLLPVTEHKYGYVPFVVQGGPGGEPLFTDTAKASGDPNRLSNGNWRSGPSDDWGMRHKLTSSIHLQKPRHNQLEMVMNRITTALSDSTNPAYILTQDILSGANPISKINRKPGVVNTIGITDQLQVVPSATPPMDYNAFMQQIRADEMTGKIPLGMYGNQQGSQQTGNSMSVASESGMDHITPWISAMETYQTRKMEMKIMSWRNFGHLTRFQNGQENTFLVPVSKPTSNQELARALTPELIDAIGPRVNVTMTRLRTQELLQLANVAGTLIPLGFPRRRMFEKMGEHDYDRLREEAMEEAEWETMQSDPQLRNMIKIPMQIKSWMDQATDENERATYAALLDYWMENLQMQQAAMQQQQMMGQGGSQSPGLPPGGGQPPAPGGAMPGSNTMNFAGMGQPPGVNGAPVGRPQGM